MPRKIYYAQMKSRWIKSNTHYGHIWINEGWNNKPPYAPSWRRQWKKPALIHKGKKAR